MRKNLSETATKKQTFRAPREAQVVGKLVYLRFLRSSDREEFIALNRASKKLHRGLVSPPTQAADFVALVKRSSDRAFRIFVVCRIEDGAIVGSINLSQIFRGGFQNAYLGYYVGAPYARRGYITEAVSLMLTYAFQTLRLHRLEANIQPGNLPSIAIVKRAGFVREGYSRRYLKICGRWRDHERWAIIAEDWKRMRKRRRQKTTVRN